MRTQALTYQLFLIRLPLLGLLESCDDGSLRRRSGEKPTVTMQQRQYTASTERPFGRLAALSPPPVWDPHTRPASPPLSTSVLPSLTSRIPSPTPRQQQCDEKRCRDHTSIHSRAVSPIDLHSVSQVNKPILSFPLVLHHQLNSHMALSIQLPRIHPHTLHNTHIPLASPAGAQLRCLKSALTR